ncbi:HXXEE domain-containing protein [Nonomuraea sp. NPDC023979]|uniref:HXXEE domain-containing protein n=1 Tax=Nonomuraea sp. NPDC023979 TaxID=3154796 RepID=UPI00340CC2F2
MERVPATVTWGLLAAWMVHDAEELATMAGWARAARPRLEKRFPGVPWERLEVSQRHVNVAIGLMGGVMAGASALGARTGGRSATFQTVLLGFGAHGVVHLAQAAATRGYTPGVVTSPLVVIPFSVWAWRRLKASGVPVAGGAKSWAGLAAFPLLLGGVHAVAHAVAARRPADGPGNGPGEGPGDGPAPGARVRRRFSRDRWF